MSARLVLVTMAGLALSGCYEFSSRYGGRPVCTPADAESSNACLADCPRGTDIILFSADTLACAAIPFDCPVGFDSFVGSCGCGCAPAAMDGTDTSTTSCPDADAPEVTYLGDDQTVCEVIEFTCPEGQARFDSTCGCGCEAACPDPTSGEVHYLSDDPDTCDLITFSCPAGCAPFDDGCGCGCIEPPPGSGCPDPNDPGVLYVSTSTAVCDEISLACGISDIPFDDDCGCGCLR